MAGESKKSGFEHLIGVLAAEGVEFIVVGDSGVSFYDVSAESCRTELCYNRTPENCQRLAAALRKLSAAAECPQVEPCPITDAQRLASVERVSVSTRLGDLELVGHVEPLGGYEVLLPRVQTFRVAEKDVRVIDLDDLIVVNKHSDDARDALVVKRLRLIRHRRQIGLSDDSMAGHAWGWRVCGEILKVLLSGAIACGLGVLSVVWLSDWWVPPSGHECFAVLLLIVVSLFGFWYSVTRRIRPILEEQRRRLEGTCIACDYNLTGNVSGICPECGTPIPPSERQSVGSEKGSNG